MLLMLLLFQLPDHLRTPGVANPAVNQSNIAQTICNPHWSTKSIRPPTSYTDKLKLQQMKELGLSGKPSDYEEDHFWPLEIGGHPTDPHNLWPEPWHLKRNGADWGAHTKDRLENQLHKLVCAKTILLSEAQSCISTDWIACYHKWVTASQGGKR